MKKDKEPETISHKPRELVAMVIAILLLLAAVVYFSEPLSKLFIH